MKIYNEFVVARMNSTSALLASLPKTFTSKEFNAIREQKACENSGVTCASFVSVSRAHIPYSLGGLREIGAIVIAFTEPIQIEKLTPIYEVFVRSTGESLFTGTNEECENFIGEDWRRLGMSIKCRENREITVQRHHYSVDYEAYRTYIRETFGTI